MERLQMQTDVNCGAAIKYGGKVIATDWRIAGGKETNDARIYRTTAPAGPSSRSFIELELTLEKQADQTFLDARHAIARANANI